MCTCIEDLYRAEIRVQLGPTVLLGVGALLVYRLVMYVADLANVSDAEDSDAEYSDDSEDSDEAEDSDAEDSEPEDPATEDYDAQDYDAEDYDAEDPEDAPYDPSAEDPDAEDPDSTYPYADALTATSSFWHSKAPNALFDHAEDPEIFPDDDTEYVTSLIDAPVLAPDSVLVAASDSVLAPDSVLVAASVIVPELDSVLDSVLAPVISSTAEASSDAVPPCPETDGTPSGSSPPGDV
jgi:hypothetical protein